MELEEFISKTLASIYKGVKNANKEIDGYIKFDVAVTANNSDSAKGAAGIRVWSIGVGAEKEASSSEQTVSRIKFGIAPSTTTG